MSRLFNRLVMPANLLERVPPAEENGAPTKDPKRDLIERVVASPSFAKSERLCQFLTFICELSLRGKEEEINEVNIGIRLFGRANYDPAVDGIVRSHASRLRQRLDQYFSQEGSDEPLRIVLPKGTYVPAFESRPAALDSAADPELRVSASGLVETTASPDNIPRRFVPWAMKFLGTALLCCCTIICYLLFLLHRAEPASRNPLNAHPLWASFFGSGRQALVVCSDSNLAVLEDSTERQVTLSDYATANYRMNIGATKNASASFLQDLAGRRYTGIASVGLLSRLYNLPGMNPGRILLRYARDVLPDELKNGSAVLIGSAYSDPWVSLFEPHMNFVFRNDPLQHAAFVINRSPLPGEMPQYGGAQAHDSHIAYGVVALRPNLGASGKILILEGTYMAGTEAAADFVFDDHLLLPFLAEIRGRDGRLPYFEVLLQSASMNDSASQISIVSYRTSSN